MDTSDTGTVPADFEALRADLLQRKNTLPKRLRQVAEHALHNPDDIAFGTVASIAAAAEVQPSTLIRFAQHLGFEGFSSLQSLFRERLRGRQSAYGERLEGLRSGGAVPQAVTLLDGFAEAGHRSLDALAQGIDPAAFGRAAERLARAETIYLMSKRRSHPIGAYMAYAFARLGIRCQMAGTAAGIDDDLLALATPRDVGFAISFSPYAPETVAQARGLAGRGVPVLSLTDSLFSPLAELSAEWFEIVEADHAGFRLLSASMTFAMALTVAVAQERERLRDSGNGT